MPDGLYEHDILAWSERQSELMRRLAAGERVNDAVDWKHVIEEVYDVGQSELRACCSFLKQAIIHLLKVSRSPGSASVRHWRSEIVGFLDDAQDRFSPSMRTHIDLDLIFRKAAKRVNADSPGLVAPTETCPFTLDALLDENADIDTLLARLSGD